MTNQDQNKIEPTPDSVGDKFDLACDEFEEAHKAGKLPTLEDFLQGWKGSDKARLLRELVILDTEYRRRQGCQLPQHDYESRFPDHRHVITSVFEAKTVDQGRPHEPGLDERLGDFHIIGPLGRGGMGVVYEAQQISIPRRVALKVLPLAGLVDAKKLQRFQNEVRAVATLDHPNVVSVYAVGEERGVHYFAMQLIRGRSLAEVIKSLQEAREQGDRQEIAERNRTKGQLADRKVDNTGMANAVAPNEEGTQAFDSETAAAAHETTIPSSDPKEFIRAIVSLGIQAANALQHAHDQGVIHRDIKPANLLIDRNAKLYVTDFGLARFEADVGVTMTGDLIGTLRYMAPEQALAKRVVDQRADIYSLAVSLYELLTLQPAFPTQDRQLLLKQIAFEEPTPLRSVDANIPVELETIVHKAMSKDIDDRYASCEALADDLRRFLEHRPIKAKPPTLPQQVSKWTRRNPTIVWACIIATLLIASVVAAGSLLVWKERNRVVQSSRVLAAAQAQTQSQLKITTITRLAAEARAIQEDRPILATLLAAEAVERSRRENGSVLPIAHEALLNATQLLRRGQTLTGHNSTIKTVAMSEDWLVTHGENKVHLWDLAAKRPEAAPIPLGSNDQTFGTIAASEDGRWLVTSGSRLQKWDLKARNPAAAPTVLQQGADKIDFLDLTSDGRWLATKDSNGEVRLWDLVDEGGDPHAMPGKFDRVLVNGAGNWLVGTQTQSLLLWKLNNLSSDPRVLIKRHQGSELGALAIDRNGRWLAAGISGRVLGLWDLTAEDVQASKRSVDFRHGGRVIHLRFTPDSRSLLVTTGYATRIHRVAVSEPDSILSRRESLNGHNTEISSLTLSSDSRWLVSGGRDGTARFWDLQSNQQSAAQVLRAQDAVRSLSLHREGRWLATAGEDGTAKLWDLRGEVASPSEFVLVGHQDEDFSTTAVSSDGRRIATSLADDTVQLWDLEATKSKTFSRVLEGPSSTITSLVISPSGQWLAAGCRDSTAHVWNLSRTAIESSRFVLGEGLESQDDMTGTLVIGPKSRSLALARADGSVALWDLSAERIPDSIRSLRGHDAQVCAMAISGDGNWLVTTARQDPQLQCWDLREADPTPTAMDAGGYSFSLAIDSDSRWLAASPNSDVWLWDLASREPNASARVLSGPEGGIWRVVISPDAHWLLTTRMNRKAQLWDLQREPPTLHELRGHSGFQSAGISPNGRWLVGGGREANVHVWDLSSPDPASSVRVLRGHKAVVWSVCFSSDSRWLITDASDGTIRRWCLDMEWLLNYTREAAGRELTDTERQHYGINDKD